MLEEALEVGRRCINLFFWSKSECQWRVHYESIDGTWEWYFW